MAGKFLIINGGISLGASLYVALKYPDTLFDRVMNGIVVGTCSFILGMTAYMSITSNISSNPSYIPSHINNTSYDYDKFWRNTHKEQQQRLEENRVSWQNHYIKMDNRSYESRRKYGY